jgi:hypothetical protein
MKGKKCKAGGGGLTTEIVKKSPAYDVIKEAEGKKKGGKVMSAEGGKSKHRMDRPRRASGGRVGSDKNPFSSARKASSPGKAAD